MITRCPMCDAQPFEPFLRGEVARFPFKIVLRRRFPFIFFVDQPALALICWKCKEIVGYE